MIKIFGMIEDLLSGKVKDIFEFSADLQVSLCEEYEKMKAENKDVAEILIDKLPEICDEVEPNHGYKDFIEKVREQYERAMQARL